MDMLKTSASQLKARLGQYLRSVKAGRSVLVTDRDEPVAKLVPVRPADTGGAPPLDAPRDPGSPPPGRVVLRGVRVRGSDTTAELRADRDRR
jgi:prevent-host-death family protein